MLIACIQRKSKFKTVNRKVQGVPQANVAANPCHKEEEKKDTLESVQNKPIISREAYRQSLSSPSEVITMLNRIAKQKQKHENKEQGKTQHETPRIKHYKATPKIRITSGPTP